MVLWAICVLFGSSSASGQKRNLLYRQLFGTMGLYEPCGRVNRGFAPQEAVVTDAQAQEMVGLLTKMEASLASRVSSIGDERMPSTQVFQRVETLAALFGKVVGELRDSTVSRWDGTTIANQMGAILGEMRKSTLALESIRMHLNSMMVLMADKVEKMAPKRKAR